MKLRISVLFFLAVFSAGVAAVEVNVNEIQKTRRVNFINYSGPAKPDDGVKNIYAIGYGLGSGILKAGDNQKINFTMKYSMIHAVSDQEKDKLSADILIINPEAKVDHIKNIRRIIAGYLQRKYDYSEKDALTLAIFTTYYNAVYRNNMDFFKSRYKTVVISKLDNVNAGIALNYTEWPGKTRIVIPLTEDSMRGTIEKLDPDELADEKTRDEMRNDGTAVEIKKDMLDIQKDNLKDEKKQLETDKKEVADDKKQIAAEKKDLESQKKDVAEEKKKIESKKTEIAKISDPVKKNEETKKLEDMQKQAAEKSDNVSKNESQIKEKEQAVSQKEENIKQQEKKIQDSEQQIKQEEKEIARDEVKEKIKQGDPEVLAEIEKREEKVAMKENELDRREDQLKEDSRDRNVYSDKIYYLRIREYLRNGNYNNDMYLVDTKAMKIIKKSDVPNIAGSRYDVFSKGVVVITRKEDTYTENRLTMLDLDSLDAIVTGEDNIFHRSFIEIRDGFIFAVVVRESKYYLGMFDQDLKMVHVSNIEIHEDTFISFFGDKIYINNRDKKIMVLKKDDLSFITVVSGAL